MIIFLSIYVPHLEILPFKRQSVSFRRAKLYKKGEIKWLFLIFFDLQIDEKRIFKDKRDSLFGI